MSARRAGAERDGEERGEGGGRSCCESGTEGDMRMRVKSGKDREQDVRAAVAIAAAEDPELARE